MATPYRGYTEIPGSAVPDVPFRVNAILREIDADVQRLSIGQRLDPIPADQAVAQYLTTTGTDARNALEDVVGDTLAADPTVAAAAAGAVDEAVNTADLLRGSDTRLPKRSESDEISFAVTDAEGRRSWLEADEAGRPSEHSLEILRADLELEQGSALPASSGYAYAIVDAEGKLAAGIKLDGTFAPEKIDLPADAVTAESLDADLRSDVKLHEDLVVEAVAGSIVVHEVKGGARKVIASGAYKNPQILTRDRITFEDEAGIRYYSDVDGAPAYRLLSAPEVACYGDSLTAAGYPAALATLLGTPVANRGISSQAPAHIAARQGGKWATITVEGGMIPDSGSVPVTVNIGILQGATQIRGSLAGVPGLLKGGTTTAYSFTRDASGPSVTVAPGTEFLVETAFEDDEKTQILWYGRNNPGATLEYVEASIAFLKPAVARYLVIAQINSWSEFEGTSTWKTITEYNSHMQDVHGDNFVDIRRWLIDEAIHEAGYTPTAADLENMSKDAPPPSIMADHVHPKPEIYPLIAAQIADRFTLKGWK
jgi:hypothetical protein